MHSIISITTAPAETRLTTLQRVKDELGITTGANDALLTTKIDEATSDIEAHLSRTLCRAGLTETIWSEGFAEYFVLARAPVASITSVTIDDEVVDADEYRLDTDAGILYRLDASGYPCVWSWCKSVVIVYAAGYIMPGQSGRDLPFAIEAGAVSLVQSFWRSKGRDTLVKEEEIPGVMRTSYWVGAVGQSGELPPDVISKIAPFRRPSL